MKIIFTEFWSLFYAWQIKEIEQKETNDKKCWVWGVFAVANWKTSLLADYQKPLGLSKCYSTQ